MAEVFFIVFLLFHLGNIHKRSWLNIPLGICLVYNIRMGVLETENKKQIRATKIQKAILGTVAAVGLISVALVLPNALQALKLFGIDKKLRKNQERSINNCRQKLIKKGLLRYSDDGYICLTSLGEETLRKIRLADYRLEKPRKWDKKWRMLIFDIKETHRGLRDKVRNTLVSIGFMRLQNSVWVYPYDCEDLITLLKADFEIGKEVLYVIADKIENEKVLLNDFGLEK
jgi:CRISPR-associated endonuclease Cas2